MIRARMRTQQWLPIWNTDALLESDLMIAVLDGATIDVGVASEIGGSVSHEYANSWVIHR